MRIDDGRFVTVGRDKKNEAGRFCFDLAYDDQSNQQQIYDDLGRPQLEKAFGGFNSTIFAYGQTGSGKTHCMLGEATSKQHAGIIPRMTAELFQRIADESTAAPEKKFLVQCSYFEIYNEVVYDLLDPSSKRQGLDVREDKALGVYVQGLQEIVVDTSDKIRALMEQGARLRRESAPK